MKTKLTFRTLAFPALLLATLHSQLSTAFAQGTAFTYQGRLNDGANPATGSYDLRFGLFGSPSGPLEAAAVTNSAVPVSNGLFTVTVDFGSNAFPASTRWLEIGARPSGPGAFNTMSPRQQITPTPFAIRAANFSGTVTASQLPAGFLTNGATGVSLSGTFSGSHTGTFTGNGAALSNLNLTTLGGLTAADFWQLGGNDVSPGDVLGSTNNRAVVFVVNGFTALRLEPNSMVEPNLVGGNGNSIAAGVYGSIIGNGFANTIQSNVTEAVIAGGQFNTINPGSSSTIIGSGNNNTIQTNVSESAIVGGGANSINNSGDAFIGGGFQNSLLGGNTFSSIVGGYQNALLTSANYAAICGGRNNTNAASTATIAGGQNNTAQAAADNSFIGAGLQNITTGQFGMIPGGFANSAASQCFAAGRRAKAINSGCFVWADSTDADFATTAINQVRMRANGGYFLYSDSGATLGATLAHNATSWGMLCDRNAKKNFAPVDSRQILDKLAGMPLQWWNYKAEADDSTPHLGPMAQDFKAAFYPGRDDKIITTLEFDGVELAAIQGLNQKVEAGSRRSEHRSGKLEERLQQQETEIAEMRRVNASLARRLERIEQELETKASIP
jgi:hypothetical protein